MGDVKELREKHGLTRQQFSDLFCIPLRTVQSWELEERSCPLYVFRMMEELLGYYVSSGVLYAFRNGGTAGG